MNAIYFEAILIGLLAYVLVKFAVSKIKIIAELAEIVGFVVGVFVALFVAGIVK